VGRAGSGSNQLAEEQIYTSTELERLRIERGLDAKNMCTVGIAKSRGEELGPLLDRLCGQPPRLSRAIAALHRSADAKLTTLTGVAGDQSLAKATCDALPASDATDPDLSNLRDVCRPSVNRSGIGVALLTSVVGGLGEFLKDRAKQELVAYAVEVFGKQVCLSDPEKNPIRRLLTPKGGEFVFERSCVVAFPSADEELDYGAVADGRFQQAFVAELQTLPMVSVGILLDALSLRDGQKRVLTAFGQVAIGELSPLFDGGTFDAEGLLRRIDAKVETRLGPPSLACDVKKKFGAECAALLALRLSAAVEKAVAGGSSVLDEVQLIEDAGGRFCKSYGDGKASLACLGINDSILDAAKHSLAGMTPGEITLLLQRRLAISIDAPELGVDLLALITKYRDGYQAFKRAAKAGDATSRRKEVLEGLRAVLPPTLQFARRELRCVDEHGEAKKADGACDAAQRAALDVLEHGLDATLALGDRDVPGVGLALKAIFAVPAVRAALGDRGTRAIDFVLDLGTVKNADDAKKVFESAAEPLGSYRVKYDAGTVIAINGFVGPRLGGTALLHRSSSTSIKQRDAVSFDALPLTGPVGLDFSFRGDRQHVGFMITAIDPLGMVTIEKGEDTRIDWGAVLTPGIMARWGIQRSPLVLYGNFQWQPLKRPELENVAGEEILGYDGAITFGGGLAVDIPIFILCAE
jgi:hypothetical protein